MSKQKKYHYIYRTTCIITGKFYVGMHSTDDLDDGYLGSGKILGYSRHKYGDENHKREILEMLPSREALRIQEKEVVNEELLSHPLNINLKYGGEGGWDAVNNTGANLYGRNGENGTKALARKTREQQSKDSVLSWKEHRSTMLPSSLVNVQLATKAASSKESIDRRKATFDKIAHQCGNKNSQFGTCWVTNGTPIKIKKEQLNEYLANGYSRGRKSMV